MARAREERLRTLTYSLSRVERRTLAQLSSVSQPISHSYSYFFYVRVSDLLIVANSSLNFVIYCFCSRRFRSILVALVGCSTDDQQHKA